ncbi:glycoside hydrolase family 140 protein [Maribellus sediminis]|uniref:glycoside hydrolase family 140 protein n=1 Tax=Maribellus sediminis TaxID=2696285 RepID=UPI001431B4C3|nr:glycoside hydrolase family 140 protein [Maribellus sediminis]
MRRLFLVSISLILLLPNYLVFGQETVWKGKSVDFSHGKLQVSENHRFLVFDDGSPFFYLGDTAWELFHRLSKEDAEKYLENRRAKGFTVIQAVILAELDGLNTPNMEGEKPLVDNDPTKINEAYFKHVDWVIRKAEEKGLFVGLLPTWGDKVDKKWGVGPVIFNAENARKYGEIVGNRYKDFKNIIWINGGDRSGGGDNFPIWNALAEGIKSVDKNHLMTFHPMGENSSSMWFHNSDWLDFNMMQTGHGQRSYAIYQRMMVPDYQKTPVKPVFDGEPRYEDHPHGWKPEELGWFDDADVRQACYWNLFSGGFGHTYGCHAIWQMLSPDRDPVGFARNNWYDDIDLPGAWDMIHARKLMESRPFTDRIPFPQIVKNESVPETDYIVATRGEDYVMVYIPTGLAASLDLRLCEWPKAKAWWYNCRTGDVSKIGKINTNQIKSFKPETSGRGEDYVLILDNASKRFGAPGK